MGATLGALEGRGLVARTPDPQDGRRALVSITDEGLALLRNRRGVRNDQMAQALSTGFTPKELRRLRNAAPLIERLAESL